MLFLIEIQTKKQTPVSKAVDPYQNLQDPKLREALDFLPNVFVGKTTESAVFLCKFSKPDGNITLNVSPQGLVIDPIPKELKGDCTIICDSTVFTSVVFGSLNPFQAIQSGQFKIDKMEKLQLFGKAFIFDDKKYQEYKLKKAQLATSNQENATQLVIAMKKYFSEILEEDNLVVKLLKTINSATISPAIIELKFALGKDFMTKDVPSTWKFEIYIDQKEIIVISRKKEQDLKGRFTYDWEISISFDRKEIECKEIDMFVTSILFSTECSKEDKQAVEKILSKYQKKQPPKKQLPENLTSSGNNNKTNDSKNPTTTSQQTQQLPTENIPNSVIEVYENGDRYEGQLNEKNERHGRGIYSTKNGDLYIGDYKNGLRHGKGLYTMKDGTRYEGMFQNGRPNGEGTYVFENGDIYAGQFKDDEFHGEGSWSSKNNSSYEGWFKNGKRHGNGVSFSQGATYDGEWVDGVFKGMGIYIYPNGDLYEGDFENGKFNGYGHYIVSSTNASMEGQFKDGKPVSIPVEAIQLKVNNDSKERFETWKKQNEQKIEQRRKIHQKTIKASKK